MRRLASFETRAAHAPQDDSYSSHGEEPAKQASRTTHTGAAVVAIASTWLGTPYQHQASLKGAGCDCLGLVRGVWRELYGSEPESLPPYRPDWAEVMGDETLLTAANRWLLPADPNHLHPGDVVLFRMSPEASVKHCAIVSRLGPPEPRIIHAYWGRAVVESWLGPWWRRRLVAAFRFPDIPSE